MGAKHTGHLIPLCHPLQLTDVQVTCTLVEATHSVAIQSVARFVGWTVVAVTYVMVCSQFFSAANVVEQSMLCVCTAVNVVCLYCRLCCMAGSVAIHTVFYCSQRCCAVMATVQIS